MEPNDDNEQHQVLIIPPNTTTTLAPGASYDRATVLAAVTTWARTTYDPVSPRYVDMVRDGIRVVMHCFDTIAKHPGVVTPPDIQRWHDALTARGQKPATIYASTSAVSSFYTWASSTPPLSTVIPTNPVTLARPKAPRPYQSPLTKALSDAEMATLWQTIHAQMAHDDPVKTIVACRDYALILLYFHTGLRRREVVQLRSGDVVFEPKALVLTTQTKGSLYRTIEVTDAATIAAVRGYLEATGRWNTLTSDDPLWLSHDRAQRIVPQATSEHPLVRKGRTPGQALTSHGLVKSLKGYAERAHLLDFHLHQTRHTFARIVAEEADNLYAVMQELGHRHITTTQIYAQKVSRKKDRFSGAIAQRGRDASRNDGG